jgi:hypothetical protein
MMRKCPRTIDKMFSLFGLEIEDIGLLVLIAGLGGLIMGPIIPGILAGVGWIVLAVFKRDKPQGFLIHWLYFKGFELPGLIYPLTKVKRYSI